VDKPDTRISEVLNEIFDLFIALGATDEQLDFPILYASGRDGWAVKNLEDEKKDLTPLLELIAVHINPPEASSDLPFKMLVTLLEYDQYLGRILTGKIISGRITANGYVHALRPGMNEIEKARLTKLMAFKGLEKISIESAESGDIVAISGFQNATVADTIAAMEVFEPLTSIPIDPPTLSMNFSVNDSPLAGKEGKKLTSRMIGDRLFKEAEGNVSVLAKRSPDQESYEVSGRGELQLGILIETMRREGFEMSIGRPNVIFKKDEKTGEILEPIEELLVDLEDEFTGTVVDKLIQRKGEMVDMRPSGLGRTRVRFNLPTRGLIGYNGEFLTDTRGTGLMNRSFHAYGAYRGRMDGRPRGVLVSIANGKAVPYALFFLKDRGTLFVNPGDPVYEGMIIGENSRENELEVNPTKEKQLSNMRASGKDDNVKLPPPRLLTLEQALAYIQDDERVEVTPKSIRLRKKHLDQITRKKMSRKTISDK
jgi:GTP-binding protein